jgi:CBS domain-containing protein
MICPQCGYDNIPGADECEHCKNDLTFLDQPAIATACEVERALMEQPVRVLQPPRPISAPASSPLRDVLQLMVDKKIGCVLVIDDSELVGIFTERDVLLQIAGREQELAGDAIREWMTPNPETVEQDDSIAFAIHKMSVGGYRHLPVMKGGRPIGIISVRDVVRHLAAYLSVTSG